MVGKILMGIFACLVSVLVWAQDLHVEPGKAYIGEEAKLHTDIMKKYMRFAEVSYYFIRQANGFSCGEAYGYLAVNSREKEIYVVWTGTRRIRSIVVDAIAVFGRFPKQVPGSSVHAGFLDSTDSVYPHIVKNIHALDQDFPDYNIVFIGHSLGGASAVLSALAYAMDNQGSKDRIRVWTFGQPRVGNRPFVEYYTQMLGSQTYRVTYQADIVPHVPPWQILGYQHHPQEIHIINKQGDFYVCQNSSREDLDGAYRWATIDAGAADHVDYFGMPDITRFEPLLEW
ncbi:hypothetical protein GGI12_000671 [Dipsacomyces acuminosporus]|nr:hypothetical protein GGI12_000671 [Dipsacomyces acuminosporus]